MLTKCISNPKCSFYYFQHPEFSNEGIRGTPNDIALAQLTRDAPIDGALVSPAKLPPSHPRDYTSSECWISGWGGTWSEFWLSTGTCSSSENGPTIFPLFSFDWSWDASWPKSLSKDAWIAWKTKKKRKLVSSIYDNALLFFIIYIWY